MKATPETFVGFRVKLSLLRAAFATVRHAAARPPAKGEEQPKWPLHGIQLEVAKHGIFVIATDGKRLAVARLGDATAELQVRTVLVDHASLSKALREAKGPEVEVTISEPPADAPARAVALLAIGGAAVAPVKHAKSELPPWRDVLPARNAGSHHAIKDAPRVAKLLRGHVGELLRREEADRAEREPAWRKAAEELAQARGALEALREAQKKEVAAIKRRLDVAPKTGREAIRAELAAKRVAHREATTAPRARVAELVAAAKVRGGWEVSPSAILKVAGGAWRVTTRDGAKGAIGGPVSDEFGPPILEGGSDLTLGVNTIFLSDAIASFRGEVECRLIEDWKPIVFYGRSATGNVSLTYVVMPINLR